MKHGRPAIVLVTWRDSILGVGWRLSNAWEEWLESDGSIHETIGFLFRKTKQSVVVVQSRQLRDNPNYDAMLEIPTGAVDSIVVIRAALLEADDE